jgi:hypothetical protein
VESVKIKDNSQKKLSYEGLALRALEVNDPWLALHAQILSDSANYKLYMLSEFGQDFDVSTKKIEEAIQAAISGDERLGSKSIKSIISSFRKVLAEQAQLESQSLLIHMSSLEHFAKIKLTKKQLDNSLGRLKYSSIEPYSFISSRQEQAANYYAETIEYIGKQESSRATVALYNGDLAVFESWLISQAMESQDSNYSVAAIRWSLAVAALDMLESLPSNPKSAAREIRKALLWAVGPENAKGLKKYFLQF